MPSEPFLEEFMKTLADDLRASNVECVFLDNEYGSQTRLSVFMPITRPLHLVLIDSNLHISKELCSSLASDSDDDELESFNFNLANPECDLNLLKSLIFDLIEAQNKIRRFMRKD